MQPTIAILTVSDRCARGEQPDRSGPAAVEAIQRHLGWPCQHTTTVPDDIYKIQKQLMDWIALDVTLILTTGGTGFAPRDVTPEATRHVIEREAPGLAEAIRAASLKITPHAMLSRAVAGIYGRTLIVNLPGNPKAVRENIAILAPVLPHALQLLTDAPGTESQHRMA